MYMCNRCKRILFSCYILNYQNADTHLRLLRDISIINGSLKVEDKIDEYTIEDPKCLCPNCTFPNCTFIAKPLWGIFEILQSDSKGDTENQKKIRKMVQDMYELAVKKGQTYLDFKDVSLEEIITLKEMLE